MIKLKLKTIENVVILKLEEGTFEELSKINITGIRGLGGFTNILARKPPRFSVWG